MATTTLTLTPDQWTALLAKFGWSASTTPADVVTGLLGLPLTLNAEQAERIREALGLPNDADGETTTMAVEDLVTPDPTATAAAAAAGHLATLDPGTLAQLQRDAEQGRQLAAAAATRDRTAAVDAAVTAGRIPPSRRQHWLSALATDPALGTVLAALPAGLVPVTGEIGYAGEPQAVTEPLPWFGS